MEICGDMTQFSGGHHSQLTSLEGSPGQRRQSVGRGAADGRNKSITDFFKPVMKQERAVFCSPEKGNGQAGLPCSEHLKKSMSSPKHRRKKKLSCSSFVKPSPPSRSPIIDAFFQSVKSEKSSSSNNDIYKILKTKHPAVVVRKLFLSNCSPDGSILLKDNTYTRSMERNEKCPVQSRTPLVENSGECKTEYVDPDASSSGLSIWASTSENNSLNKESSESCDQKTGCSKMSELCSVSSSQISLETVCRQSQAMKKKLQKFLPVNKSLGMQDNRDFLRKGSHSASLESSSDESSSEQASKMMLSSGERCDKTINVTESQSNPTAYPDSSTLFGITKHRCPEKRKRISSKTNMKHLQNVQPLDKHNITAFQKKQNSNFSKERLCPDSDLQPEDIYLSGCVLPIPVENLEADANENKTYGSMTNKNDKINISDTKESQLQTFAPNIYLATTRKNLSTSPSRKMAEQLGSLREGNNRLSLEGCSHEDSEMDGLTEKLKSFSDNEVEASVCSLESSDEEILMPLEKMLSHNAKPAEKSSDEATDKDDIVATHDIPLSKSFVDCGVSYINHLEHLLKEKEELLRVDELENQLQQIKGIAEISSSLKDQSTDGELSAEHRAFIERYSFIDDAIPDQHPGESIFQMANAGKIFSQHNLDLRNFGFHPQNLIEKYLLRSEITQQLFVITEGLLISAYHNSPCPVPVLKWMFQMMSIHPDSSVSRKILDMLMTLTIRNASDDTNQQKPWIPSLLDITTVLINMGISFTMLFPLQHFQPSFTEDNIMSEMRVTVKKQSSGDSCINSTAFFHLVDTSLSNIAKFLRLCINVCPEGYTDKEKDILLSLLFKLSLEKELKQFPLVDLECLIIKLLENIRDWDNKMPQLCLAISCLSSHHHDLLWLVQFVPNWTTRGRQIRRHLSLVIILKLLKNHVNIPSSHDQQMSLLCKELVKMKPSNLLKNLSETLEHHDGLKEPFISEFEPQAYYLTYVLLHLVREASNFEHTNSNQRKWLLKLCSILEKHVKCDIREDVRLFYRTKVKDLVARTYSKWQQMIHSSPLTQGRIHDFWIPDS